MYTHTTQLSQKNNRIGTWFLCFCFILLAIFPIYRNFYYSNGLLTYERHRAVIEKRSEYYNPWQYRILCPYTIEALMSIYDVTVDKIYPIEKKIHFTLENNTGTTDETDKFIKLMQTRGAMKYMIIFILFRFFEHLLIFYLAWKLWRYFVRSKWLIFLGINFLALALGNAVAAADLSFNTYMDIIFYLATANIIVYKKNPWLLVPVTILAAFNRETSIMIPALYFISQADFSDFHFTRKSWKTIIFPPKKVWFYTVFLYVLFFLIFTGLRLYFGYRPQQVWKAPAGLPMLKLNLFSAVGAKAYLELIGTYGVIPLIILYKLRSFPYLLRKWFLFLTPVWFAVHYISVVAYQTRLFMVPFVMIMIPMILWLIENEIKKIAEKQKPILS
jgi:hypothetical protein